MDSNADDDYEQNSPKDSGILLLLLLRDLVYATNLEDKIKIVRKIDRINSSRLNDIPPVKISRRTFPRRSPVDSVYYTNYILDECSRYRNASEGSYSERIFKHRARMSKTLFDNLVLTAETEGWFPEYRWSADGRRQKRPPLALMILSALSILGGSMTFGSLPDVTNVSERSHRAFFDRFIEVGATKMFPKWVKPPTTLEELQELSSVYAMAGLPGAICSTDGVHFRMWSCSYVLKNQNIGKEGYPTRGVQISVNYSGRILSCSRTFNGNLPDASVCKQDPLFEELDKNPIFTDFEYTVCDREGIASSVKGAWAIVDNGYPPDLRFVQFPEKASHDAEHERFSRMLESIRKDVERVFGILKQRFLILKRGITLQRFVQMEQLIHTCCALHNFVLEHSGREICPLPLNTNEVVNARMYRRREEDFVVPTSSTRQRRAGKEASQTRSLLVENFEYLRSTDRLYWPRSLPSAAPQPSPYDDSIDPCEINDN